ncbi:MAG: Hsp70 family protein [Planctomycetota bacterium]
MGIDLGTTNSLVAHCTEAGPVLLTSPEGERSLPSVVRLLASAEGPGYRVEALGQEARRHAVEHPTTTLHSVKRLMGRSVTDLAEDLPHLPYRVVEGSHQTARVALPGPTDPATASTPNSAPAAPAEATVTPQEVSAILLRELKRWAEHALQTPVARAVITVPAYFDDAQRQATRDAGRLAGLDVLRIVNEPTAAALAYGLGLRSGAASEPAPAAASPNAGGSISLNTKLRPEACAAEREPASAPPPDPAGSQTIAVYDLGGGTFDVSILRLQPTAQGHLDQVLATDGDTHLGGDDFDHALIELFQSEIRSDLAPQGPALTFPPAIQQAFRTLAEQTKIQLSTRDQADVEIDLAGLADGPASGAADPRYRRTLTCDEFEGRIDPLIDRTLDACRRALKNARIDPDSSEGPGVDRVILVGGSTRIPLVRRKVAELFKQPPYTALNPDEVVALGASVQAAILAGVRRDTLLLDVTPLSLGIETMGGAVAKLITANTTLPARASEQFSTYADGQTSVKIHVLQGERELVADCRSLATFHLTGIPPMPAGLPKLNVSFLIDANGILTVHAVEERSGRRAHAQVVPHHGLTRDEVAQIEADSLTHARDDMTRHRLIDLRLNAKLDLRNIHKQLDRFPPPESPPESPLSEASPDAAAESAPQAGAAAPADLDPAYRQEIQTHMDRVQRYLDTPDEALDPDAFQQALHDLDHATIRLAELNIARTLRES